MHACKHLDIIVRVASLLKRLTITFSLYYILVVCSGSGEPSKHVKKWHQYTNVTSLLKVKGHVSE